MGPSLSADREAHMTTIVIKGSAKRLGRQSNESLMHAIADGDSAAMHALYQRHCERVKRFVLRLTDNASIADDIVSEVFLEVWRRADTFESRSQVTTWLLAIARNKAISMLKRGCGVQLDEKAAQTIEDPSDDPEAAVGKLRRDAIIHKCLEHLRPAHRQVVDLVYYQDKSIGEVADLIGIPPSTVKTRMFYARTRIAHELSKEGVGRTSL
jgi:RNA polymerase sigma-70 factor (ECF subfamily)